MVRAFLLPALFLVVITGFAVAGRLPLAAPVLYVIASVAAFLTYAWDKSAAQADQWRTSESTLHLLGLVGGWPGALAAQQVFRHKTKKRSFIVAFWVTVALNCGALLWVLSPQGQQFLAALTGR